MKNKIQPNWSNIGFVSKTIGLRLFNILIPIEQYECQKEAKIKSIIPAISNPILHHNFPT
jgi:hypothetical protein